MIISFGDRATEDLFHERPTRYARRIPADIVASALRKLDLIDAAEALMDLKAPPGNRLEMLRGDLQDCHSIRINERWRIVFRWKGRDAYEVRIMDYHGG